MECNVKQKDLATNSDIIEKSMYQKECREVNKFKLEEMIEIIKILKLLFPEFDVIFFTHKLTKWFKNTFKINYLVYNKINKKE